MLTTRCPSCNTVFRIRAEQLNQRGGRVRCGHCHTAFLALSTLEEMPDDTVLTGKPSAPVAAAPEQAPAAPPPAAPPPAPAPEQAPEPAPAPVEPPEPVAPPPEPTKVEADPEPEPVEAPSAAHSPSGFVAPEFEIDIEAQSFAARTQLSPDFVEIDETGRIEPKLGPDVAIPEFEIPLDDEDLAEPRERTSPEEPDEERIEFSGLHPELDDDDEATPAASKEPPTEATPDAPRIVLHGEGHADTLANVLEQMSDEDNAMRRENLADPPTVFLDDEVLVPPSRRGHPGRWMAGAALLLVIGLLQATYLFRTELSSRFPELREPLTRACEALGCTVPYPTRAEDISVDATDLNPDTAQNGRYTLTVTLRNRARFLQAWPHLELTLTDRFDRAIARRVMKPDEWLPAGMAQSPAFPPRGEITAQVGFATDLPAAGYRLYAFYP